MEKREKKIEELKMAQNSINFGVFVGLMLVLLFQVSQSITRLKEFIQDRELHVILDYKKPNSFYVSYCLEPCEVTSNCRLYYSMSLPYWV